MIKENMNCRRAIGTMILTILLYMAAGILPFPIEGRSLSEEVMLKQAGHAAADIRKKAETPGRSSIYWFIEKDGRCFLIKAEKSPFFHRYRIYEAMKMESEEQKYETTDFFYKVVWEKEGDNWTFFVKRHYNMLVVLFPLFASVINAIYYTRKAYA